MLRKRLETSDLLRLVDSIHRDKGISKDLLFEAIEEALLKASCKRFGPHGDLSVKINRISGDIEAYEDGRRMDPNAFGRIPAQTAKQIMIQKIREAERDVIYSDYEAKIDTVLGGYGAELTGPIPPGIIGRSISTSPIAFSPALIPTGSTSSGAKGD